MNVLIKAYVLLSRNILSVPFREKNRKRFSTFSSLISSGFDWGLRAQEIDHDVACFRFMSYF